MLISLCRLAWSTTPDKFNLRANLDLLTACISNARMAMELLFCSIGHKIDASCRRVLLTLTASTNSIFSRLSSCQSLRLVRQQAIWVQWLIRTAGERCHLKAQFPVNCTDSMLVEFMSRNRVLRCVKCSFVEELLQSQSSIWKPGESFAASTLAEKCLTSIQLKSNRPQFQLPKFRSRMYWNFCYSDSDSDAAPRMKAFVGSWQKSR